MDYNFFTLTNEDNEVIGIINTQDNCSIAFSELIQEAIKEHYTATEVFFMENTFSSAYGGFEGEAEEFRAIITLDDKTEPLYKFFLSPACIYDNTRYIAVGNEVIKALEEKEYDKLSILFKNGDGNIYSYKKEDCISELLEQIKGWDNTYILSKKEVDKLRIKNILQ